jgi:hypothetical protein
MGTYNDERPSSKPASPPPPKADCYVLQRYLPRPMLLDGLKVMIPHHETFIATIQSPYSSTKG